MSRIIENPLYPFRDIARSVFHSLLLLFVELENCLVLCGVTTPVILRTEDGRQKTEFVLEQMGRGEEEKDTPTSIFLPPPP